MDNFVLEYLRATFEKVTVEPKNLIYCIWTGIQKHHTFYLRRNGTRLECGQDAYIDLADPKNTHEEIRRIVLESAIHCTDQDSNCSECPLNPNRGI